MGPVRLENPQAFWLLAPAAAVVLLATFRSAAVAGAGRRLAVGAFRCLWLALCVAALAGPVRDRRVTVVEAPRVVQLIDESASVADDRDAVRQARERLLAALGPGVRTDELRFAAQAWAPGEKPAEPDQTDIEAALDAANGRTLNSANCHIVLLTDARSTRGDPAAAAARIAARGGTVSVVPVGRHRPAPPRVAAVEPPVGAKVGVPSSVRVTLASDEPVRGVARLRDPAGEVVDRRELPVEGEATLVLHFTPKEGGFRNYAVEFESRAAPASRPAAPAPGAGATARTDTRGAPVFVEGPPRLLLCDNFPDEAAALRRALEPLNLPIDVASPTGWPDDLTPYAAVVVSDFSGKELTPDQRGALRKFVEQAGGGLVFIGGGNVVPSRWASNPLADALPVVLRERPAKVVAKLPDVSVCFVIDRSGSMHEPLPSPGGEQTSKLELVKAAIQASVQTLPESGHVAVVAFDTQADVVVPPTPVGTEPQKEDVAREVDGISVGGGTAMAAGIDKGMELLAAMPGDKYLVVLTDGDSTPPANGESWDDIAARAAARNLSWTSIAVGTDADQRLLRAMANRAGGSFFYCGTGDQIPKVFVDQAKAMRRVAELKQKPFRPRPGPDENRYRGPAVGEMPELNGMVLASPKPGADVLLLGEQGDPLLAARQFGLGKVVAFTSDAKTPWASRWVKWPRFSQFWLAVVQGVMRPPQSYHTRVRSHVSGNRAYFLFQVRDGDDRPVNGLTGSGQLRSEGPASAAAPAGAAAPSPDAGIMWKQTAPGDYEASVAVPAGAGAQSLSISLQGSDGRAVRYGASLSGTAGAETAETGPDLAAADAIARAGGGIVSTDAGAIAALSAGQRRHEFPASQPLWPWLVGAAVLLWPFDLLLRKLL